MPGAGLGAEVGRLGGHPPPGVGPLGDLGHGDRPQEDGGLGLTGVHGGGRPRARCAGAPLVVGEVGESQLDEARVEVAAGGLAEASGGASAARPRRG